MWIVSTQGSRRNQWRKVFLIAFYRNLQPDHSVVEGFNAWEDQSYEKDRATGYDLHAVTRVAFEETDEIRQCEQERIERQQASQAASNVRDLIAGVGQLMHAAVRGVHDYLDDLGYLDWASVLRAYVLRQTVQGLQEQSLRATQQRGKGTSQLYIPDLLLVGDEYHSRLAKLQSSQHAWNQLFSVMDVDSSARMSSVELETTILSMSIMGLIHG